MSFVYNMVKGLSKITTMEKEVYDNIIQLDFRVVNAFMIGNINGQKNNWVLVDAGLENSAEFIFKTAEKHFGENVAPKAIILTHGHFDHIGSLENLINKWHVPIYAHKLEFPYLTGKKNYVEPDHTVGGGMVSAMSEDFPHNGIDIADKLYALPDDGTIRELPNWRWIHTPGHTEGHISLMNLKEGIIIIGDAFTTLKQESFMSVLTHKEEISGPPKYLTTDWMAARESVEKIRKLQPKVALLSHGNPLKNDELTKHLDYLVINFNNIAVPENGKYLE